MQPSTIPHSRPWISAADIEATITQLRSGMIAEGDAAAELERRLAKRYGFDQAIVTGSGCQALLLALTAAGTAPGARVAVPTYVCPEVLGVIEAIGAVPMITDVGADYLLNPDDPIFNECDSIVAPALLGRALDAHRFRGFKGPVIADWAQYAPMAPSRESDAFDIAIVSFEATKLISAGEGGAVLVRDRTLGEKLRGLKQINNETLKLNLYPLSDLQAALALSQLARLDEIIQRRADIAARYSAALGVNDRHPSSVAFRFVVRVGDAAKAIERFARRGIIARRPVDPLLHHVRPQPRAFAMADTLFEETISLPCHPSLSDDEIERVANAVKELLA